MMKLIGGSSIDLKGLDPTYGARRSDIRGTHPQEPIQVHVRMRAYAGALPQMRPVRPSGPDLSRLPIGATLDCYL